MTALLIGLLLLWLVSPLAWLIVSGAVYPDSGIEPTLDQRRSMAWVNLAFLTFAAGVPLIVLATAWLSRQVVLAVAAAAAFVASNLLLILLDAPIWTLFAASIDTLA